jgi:hypothetical protein
MDLKHWFGLAASAMSVFSLVLYMGTILAGKTKPHAFSWIIWSALMGVLFVAQYTHEAGAGAWQTAVSTFMCGAVGVLSLFRGEKHITRSDWVALIGALSTIPLWIVLKDPLVSVILLMVIDVAGYFPTFRKSYPAPYQENIWRPFRALIMIAFTIAAMKDYNFITMIYPIVFAAMEVGLVTMLLWRRRSVSLSPYAPAPSE